MTRQTDRHGPYFLIGSDVAGCDLKWLFTTELDRDNALHNWVIVILMENNFYSRCTQIFFGDKHGMLWNFGI